MAKKKDKQKADNAEALRQLFSAINKSVASGTILAVKSKPDSLGIDTESAGKVNHSSVSRRRHFRCIKGTALLVLLDQDSEVLVGD